MLILRESNYSIKVIVLTNCRLKELNEKVKDQQGSINDPSNTK